MKKILIRVGVGLAVLAILALVGVSLFLDRGIKHGIETFGPALTKVSITLEGVSLSILSGTGSVNGLVVGNPEGYKTPHAMRLASARLSVQPSSILADKVVIRSISVQGAELTFEGDLKGNNLSQIQKNVEAATGGGAAARNASESSGGGVKLQVDDFVFAGANVTVNSSLLAGRSVTLSLPEIHLTELGRGPEGITAADLTRVLCSQITLETLQAVTKELSRAGKEVLDGATESAKGSLDQGQKAVRGVTDLFKKKQ